MRRIVQWSEADFPFDCAKMPPERCAAQIFGSCWQANRNEGWQTDIPELQDQLAEKRFTRILQLCILCARRSQKLKSPNVSFQELKARNNIKLDIVKLWIEV